MSYKDFIIFDLKNHIIDSLKEYLFEEQTAPAPVAIYVGRFQPFHRGHFSIYDALTKKFGPDRVFIGTSDKIDAEKSPFNFAEKQQIIHKMFGVPLENIRQVKNPYAPIEITSTLPPNTPVVTAVSEKDAERLSKSKYFSPWTDSGEKSGYKDKGYFIVAPEFKMDVDGGNISGTQVRKVLGDPNRSDIQKQQLFKQLYGKFDPEVFNLITGKLSNKTAPTVKEPINRKKPNQNLRQRVLNPETRRKILVRTALSYPEDHPARVAAERLLKGVKNSLLYEELIEKIEQFDTKYGERTLLLCGGAAGHLSHPFEDRNLTFGEIKKMLVDGLTGSLSKESVVTEKTDGQNLMFTVVNGKVRFARSKSQLAGFGRNAMSGDDLKKKFAGRGEIEEAFGTAVDDLQSAVSSMSSDDVSKIFGDGRKFMNLEVINPKTKNVIPYDSTILIFHGTLDVDENGNTSNPSPEAGKEFTKILQKNQAEQQKTYKLQGPHVLAFSDADSEKYKEKAQSYLSELNSVMKKFNLDDNSRIQDYYDGWWSNFINLTDKKNNLNLTDEEKMGLLRRWSRGDKTFGKRNLRPESQLFFSTVEERYKNIQRRAAIAIEEIVLSAGNDIIRRTQNLLVANNPSASKTFRNQLENVIDSVLKSADDEKIQTLMLQLRKLDRSGGLENIIPSEGMVFIYKGKPYKFTGAFAPINQILGMGGFEAKRETPSEKDVETRRKNIQGLLNKRIKNPITGRNILIKSALSYDKDSPAFQLAKKYLSAWRSRYGG